MTHLLRDEVELLAAGESVSDDASAHVRECASCAAAVIEVLQAKRAIREAAPRFTAPDALRARVLREVRGESRATARMPRWPLAAAAMLAIALVATAWLVRGESAMRELVDVHTMTLASAHPVDVISTDRHTVKPWFEGRVPFAVPVPDLAPPFALEGGRVVWWRGAPGAELVVRKGAHRISVFVFDASSVPRTIGSDARMAALTWRSGALQFVAVGDVTADDLQRLREAFH